MFGASGREAPNAASAGPGPMPAGGGTMHGGPLALCCAAVTLRLGPSSQRSVTMITTPTAIAFATLAFAMALSPGPNLFYLASRSVCQGRRAAFASLAGVCAGMAGYMLATAAGLSALFTAVPLLFDAVRLAGAGYLLWLAYKAFRAPAAGPGVAALAPVAPRVLFRQGLLTCLLNPKIVLMYGALLPQFVRAEAGDVLAQTIALGSIQIAAAALAHAGVIVAAATATAFLGRVPGFARVQSRLLGCVFVALAARIGLERRAAG